MSMIQFRRVSIADALNWRIDWLNISWMCFIFMIKFLRQKQKLKFQINLHILCIFSVQERNYNFKMGRVKKIKNKEEFYTFWGEGGCQQGSFPISIVFYAPNSLKSIPVTKIFSCGWDSPMEELSMEWQLCSK